MKAFFEKYKLWFVGLGLPGLFLWAFFEAIFFPLPPDIGLIIFVKETPEIWVNLALITTIGSASGAMVGWSIGRFFKSKLEKKFSGNLKYEKIRKNLLQYGGEAIVFAGFTPLPYKLFAITSGIIGLPLKTLFWCSVLGRGARFLLVAYVTAKFQDGIKAFWSSPAGLGWTIGIIFVIFGYSFLKTRRKNMEDTFLIIKPTAFEAGSAEGILKMIEDHGFEIVKKNITSIPKEVAMVHYEEHSEKHFFPGLIKFITSREVALVHLRKENAVDDLRNLMGNTNPEKAEEGTIRKIFGSSMTANAVHGSDSKTSAKRELEIFSPLM